MPNAGKIEQLTVPDPPQVPPPPVVPNIPMDLPPGPPPEPEQIAKPVIPAVLDRVPALTQDEGFVRRFWTGGPGAPKEAIVYMRPTKDGKSYREKYRPGLDGSYVVRDPEAYEFVKRALGPRAWEDDIPPQLPSQTCAKCGWSTRSMQAFQFHTNNAHR